MDRQTIICGSSAVARSRRSASSIQSPRILEPGVSMAQKLSALTNGFAPQTVEFPSGDGQIVAHLYLPEDHDASKRYPAVAVGVDVRPARYDDGRHGLVDVVGCPHGLLPWAGPAGSVSCRESSAMPNADVPEESAPTTATPLTSAPSVCFRRLPARTSAHGVHGRGWCAGALRPSQPAAAALDSPQVVRTTVRRWRSSVSTAPWPSGAACAGARRHRRRRAARRLPGRRRPPP